MQEIDWDGVIEDAQDTPRAVLSRFLAEADKIDVLVVASLVYNADGPRVDHFAYEIKGPTFTAMGMLQTLLDDLRWKAMGK